MDNLNKLRNLTKKYASTQNVNYFDQTIEQIESEYLSFLEKPISFGDATRKYKLIKEREYLDIAYPSELNTLVIDVINTDLRQWVDQGFYKVIGQLMAPEGSNVPREVLIQKTMVTQLEVFLLRRGLRPTDISIYREVQILNDKRVDILVNYGSIGSVMIEIKRAGNPDLSQGEIEKYKNEKFIPYMEQTNSGYGIYLIYLDDQKEKNKFPDTIKNVIGAYKNLYNVEVIGIDCLE